MDHRERSESWESPTPDPETWQVEKIHLQKLPEDYPHFNPGNKVNLEWIKRLETEARKIDETVYGEFGCSDTIPQWNIRSEAQVNEKVIRSHFRGYYAACIRHVDQFFPVKQGSLTVLKVQPQFVKLLADLYVQNRTRLLQDVCVLLPWIRHFVKITVNPGFYNSSWSGGKCRPKNESSSASYTTCIFPGDNYEQLLEQQKFFCEKGQWLKDSDGNLLNKNSKTVYQADCIGYLWKIISYTLLLDTSDFLVKFDTPRDLKGTRQPVLSDSDLSSFRVLNLTNYRFLSGIPIRRKFLGVSQFNRIKVMRQYRRYVTIGDQIVLDYIYMSIGRRDLVSLSCKNFTKRTLKPSFENDIRINR